MECESCKKNISPCDRFCSQCGSPVPELHPEKIFRYAECPRCNSFRLPKVMQVTKPFRIIRCQDCNFRFRTCEIIYEGPESFKKALEMVDFL